MKNLHFLVFFLYSFLLHGQGWERTYSINCNQSGHSVQQTRDGGYIINAETDNNDGNGHCNFLILKVHESGEINWTKTFKGVNSSNAGNSIQQTFDDGYIVAGSFPHNNDVQCMGNSMFLIKTKANGDSIWTKKFSYSPPYGEWGHSVNQTMDSGYIIVGKTYQGVDSKVYLIKTDYKGDTIWSKRFGGPVSGGNSVSQISDGGYIITGAKENLGEGQSDVYLLKTDSNGNLLWEKTFGGGNNEIGNSVQQTTDGGYIIAGVTSSFGNFEDVYLVKTNSYGDLIWAKTFGGPYYDYAGSAQQTVDGGYILTGTISDGSDSDVLLVKIDANGGTLWTKTFGGPKSDVGNYVQQTSDSGYIITGGKFVPGIGMTVYLIKTDSLGNICYPSSLSQSPNICFGDSFIVGTHVYHSNGTYVDTLKTKYGGCDSIITTHLTVVQPPAYSENFSLYESQASSACDNFSTINEEIGGKSLITIFPNPSAGKFTIQSTEKFYSITITNLIGERLFSSLFKIQNPSFSIDISSEPKGIYFLEIVFKNERHVKKIIIEQP